MIPDRSELHDGDDEVVMRTLARAKGAWAASLREDDRLHRDASEQRLAAAWPRPRVLPVRSFALGAAAATAAACLMVVAFMSLRGTRGGSGSDSAARGSEVVANAAPPSALPFVRVVPVASPAASAIAIAPVAVTRAIVATGACPECRVGGEAMEPGVALGRGRALSVPRGARVTLGFAVPSDTSGPGGPGGTPATLVDPTVGVDVEGPAVATAPDDRTISLDRGSAHFRGLRDISVAVPGGRLTSAGAAFTVRVDGQGVARVHVEKGRVVVTSDASHESRDMEEGATFELAASAAPPVTAPPATAPRAATPAAGTTSVPARGPTTSATTSAATATPPGATAPGTTTPATGAAAFKLAELEMANGQRERGRARLAELTTSSDVRLASDAATLLARSEPTASARADAWARYLATSPPIAYRDRALLERADALVDAGRTNEANAILAELRSASLTDAQRRQLERIASKASERR